MRTSDGFTNELGGNPQRALAYWTGNQKAIRGHGHSFVSFECEKRTVQVVNPKVKAGLSFYPPILRIE